jgi:hypothetical protein
MRRPCVSFAQVVFAVSTAATVGAQLPASTTDSAACSYDRCALRMGLGGSWLSVRASTTVLKGMRGDTVTAGRLVPTVDVLAASDDHMRREYNASRRRYRLGNGLSVAFMSALMATLVRALGGRTNWGDAADVALPVALIGFGTASVWTFASAEDRLRRAIWHYNGTLPQVSDTVAPGCPYEQCALRVKVGLWASRVVRGASEAPVMRVGARRLPPELFAPATPSARAHVDSFWVHQRQLNATAALSRIVIASLVSGFTILASGDSESKKVVGRSILGVGYVVGCLTVAGQVEAERWSRYHLEEAVWLYNRTLPRTP